MKKILLLIIIIITFAACEKPSDCTKRYFSPQYKSYLLFNNNSYWIYKDTLLGIVDTLTLETQYVRFNEYCSVGQPPQETLEQNYKSSYFKGNNNYLWAAAGMASSSEFQGGSLLGYYNDNGGIIRDSLLINGVYYKNVTEFSFSNSKHCRAKDIGLIKRDFQSFTSADTIYHFDLIEYHLN